MLTQAVATYVVLPALVLAAALTLVRLLRGPTLPDRIVAVDLLATIAIALLFGFAVAAGQPVFIDIVLEVALLAFLGTVAFAFYIERRSGHD
jgi:multicomponent Na+:H+ antiporter subunit F